MQFDPVADVNCISHHSFKIKGTWDLTTLLVHLHRGNIELILPGWWSDGMREGPLTRSGPEGSSPCEISSVIWCLAAAYVFTRNSLSTLLGN